MPEGLKVLCRGIQQKGDTDVFKPHLVYEEILKTVTEKEKTNSILNDFLSKIN